ncbi:hypothetical protein DPMN_160284 [Dreissena polymorpha]|uniref:Uncharacterized protein n=1 Tax=Dreissena polymorpha TaxID=45954 RepID=A0A9D4EMX0_DREPO|nr:hypothetical protein DPMN_160284 [Dreissena polymorpha]
MSCLIVSVERASGGEENGQARLYVHMTVSIITLSVYWSVSGEKGLKELIEEGTPVEILEGDGDNNLVFRVKRNLNLTLQKLFDKSHVKNIFIMKNSDCQPRVTNTKKVLETLIPNLAEFLKNRP